MINPLYPARVMWVSVCAAQRGGSKGQYLKIKTELSGKSFSLQSALFLAVLILATHNLRSKDLTLSFS